jgi:hypothetical protein
MSSASLKEEGNELFVRGAFQKASDEYTEAIELDCNNPTLYAYRAACALHLKEQVNALLSSHCANKISTLAGITTVSEMLSRSDRFSPTALCIHLFSVDCWS